MLRKSQSRIGWFLSFALLVLLSVAPRAQTKAAASRVEIGYSRLRISIPVFVAAQKGYFNDAGIEANLQPFDTAQPLMGALVAGHLQMGGFTAFPITWDAMAASNVQLLSVGMLLEDSKHPISILIRRRGTAIRSIQDLKGKRVGILPTAAYQAWLTEILKANRVDPASVTIIRVAPLETASSFVSQQIDAAFTNDPAATAVLKKGLGEKVTSDALVPKYLGSPYPFGAFNVRKDYADKNPEIARKVVKALNRAIDFSNRNPAAAKEAMRSYLPEQQRELIPDFPDALFRRSDKVKEADLDALEASSLRLGIIKQHVDLKGLIYH